MSRNRKSSWVRTEMATLDLGDKRRNERTIHLLEDIAKQPGASLPQASGSAAKTKAVYRLLSNVDVEAGAIRAAHQNATAVRCQEVAERDGLVLVAQDTTEVDYTSKPGISGLGPLDSARNRGLKVHHALSMSVAGEPLGLLHQQVWARAEGEEPIAPTRRQRETADKESQRWLDTVDSVSQQLPAETPVVVMGDRESDIYDLMALARRPGLDLLIRATHNRRVVPLPGAPAPTLEECYLWTAMESEPVQGEMLVHLQRVGKRGERDARAGCTSGMHV